MLLCRMGMTLFICKKYGDMFQTPDKVLNWHWRYLQNHRLRCGTKRWLSGQPFLGFKTHNYCFNKASDEFIYFSIESVADHSHICWLHRINWIFEFVLRTNRFVQHSISRLASFRKQAGSCRQLQHVKQFLSVNCGQVFGFALVDAIDILSRHNVLYQDQYV